MGETPLLPGPQKERVKKPPLRKKGEKKRRQPCRKTRQSKKV